MSKQANRTARPFRAPKQLCVWVVEIAVLAAKRDRIAWWEVWSSHNTRQEAMEERERNRLAAKRIKFSNAFLKATTRIRKYIPEDVQL